MPPPSASPAIRLSADGVTYGAPGVKAAVDAGGTVYAKLDSIANVNQVAWDVVATDGSSLPSSFVITTSGVVPGGNQATLTALGLGTAGRLRATVNAGVGAYGNVDLTTTQSIVKWYVLAANGLEVGTVGEGFESDAVNGTAPLINAAIKNAGVGALVPNANGLIYPTTGQTQTTNATPTAMFTIPLATGFDMILTLNIKGRIRSGGLTSHSFTSQSIAIIENPGGTPALSTGTATPSSGVIYNNDETGGAISTPVTPSFSAGAVTVSLTGIAATNINWSWWYTAVVMPE